MKTKYSKGVVTAMIAVAALVGAGGGALLNSNSQANAATTTPSVATQPATDTSTSNSTVNSTAPASNGTFKSNEDPTHEKTESAAREAQEDAGQQPTIQ